MWRQGSPVWQALAGHKRRIPLAVAPTFPHASGQAHNLPERANERQAVTQRSLEDQSLKLSSQEPCPKQFCGNWKPALPSRAPGTAVPSRAVFWARSTDCSSAPGTRSVLLRRQRETEPSMLLHLPLLLQIQCPGSGHPSAESHAWPNSRESGEPGEGDLCGFHWGNQTVSHSDS